MFPYDSVIAASLKNAPQSVGDALRAIQTIDAVCSAGDGLKWFNGLYLSVTRAVQARVDSGAFTDGGWIAQLDVQFARLYFNALGSALSGMPCPGCWRTLFSNRANERIARIQFALAGMNAHINRDLPEAIVAACKGTSIVPRHGTQQHEDYTSLNSTLASLIDEAKRTLQVRLPGDPLPAVSSLEDTIAAWDIGAAREKAWTNAEVLWELQAPSLAAGLMDGIDGLTTVVGKALLTPVP